MPKRKPLGMPEQDFRKPYRDAAAPDWQAAPASKIWKYAIFGPAILTTLLLLTAFTDWLSTGGLGYVEFFLIAMVGLTFFWISLSVSTASIGLLNLFLKRKTETPKLNSTHSLDVALLVPIYNETPSEVFGNAAAMWDELQGTDTQHDFSLFILSDTQDPEIAEQELHAMATLQSSFPEGAQLYYRRRSQNTDRKTGNLTDWIEGWGGTSDAMLVLDADSLMTGEAILALSNEMANDPSVGLIQSAPSLFGAKTLFARMQQFSNVTYGRLLAEGLSLWTNREANYWGHNAIIRTAAFASCAGLPHLKSLSGKETLIMSHDFVEAGLLRRAGWAVRFLPRIQGSYEETPATLIDFALRDRRWCQGNLQHLRILHAAGLHATSRFHMLHGAISYLLSPAWFILLAFWALLSNGQNENVISYFSDTNPTMPIWPHISNVNSLLILLFMYGMLLAPKIIGAAVIWASSNLRKSYGGGVQFLISVMIELVTSIIYAPILMIQQSVAVLRYFLGFSDGWNPQKRNGGDYPIGTLIKFHIIETVTGTALLIGMANNLVSLWLLPIAISLAGAIQFSALSGVNLTRKRWSSKQLGTPDELSAPHVIVLAQRYRTQISKALDASSKMPAE
ncbi:glucans biosynthesis glucosyltransferase MdoH [Amylibacter sp. SFDW26]|nr:glucans biosynthesis glucosyltransferase MdoH [Amylibacter sp. SFDW26]